jgi:hypothetical protein
MSCHRSRDWARSDEDPHREFSKTERSKRNLAGNQKVEVFGPEAHGSVAGGKHQEVGEHVGEGEEGLQTPVYWMARGGRRRTAGVRRGK